MIKKLRKKFIKISGISLFTMIFIISAAINISFFCHTINGLNSRLADISRQNRSPEIPLTSGAVKPHNSGPSGSVKLHVPSDGCLVILAHDNTIKEIRQDNSERYSTSDVQEIVDDALSSGKEYGWSSYYRYHKESSDTAICISLINASSEINSMLSVATISLIIGIVSFLLSFLTVVLLSEKAIRPTAESYKKQKQFVTDAGHELKTPLTAISADNEVARMTFGDSEWFDAIDAQVDKMTYMVQNLILLSKMDEGITPDFKEFNMSDAVIDTVSSFAGICEASGKKLYSDKMEEGISINGSEAMIRELVSILMDNAVKYCTDGGVIKITLEKKNRKIHFKVYNSFEHPENCNFDMFFERFYRADEARTSGNGHGLGLSIAKSIVELHNGRITAYAEDGKFVVVEASIS